MHESSGPLKANSKSAKLNFSGSGLYWGGKKGDAECSTSTAGQSCQPSAHPFCEPVGEPNSSCSDRCPRGALPMPYPGPLWCQPPSNRRGQAGPLLVWWLTLGWVQCFWNFHCSCTAGLLLETRRDSAFARSPWSGMQGGHAGEGMGLITQSFCAGMSIHGAASSPRLGALTGGDGLKGLFVERGHWDAATLV